ncbi:MULTISPECIES: CCA tRNA nucleotidyltransferase [Haloarcula]|uniref:CCA tRNA nucleotidyltransferase n=1 Tax=Haloarcula TaxID=2237 RepID=UPI0023E80410|nr:CCA tRNA nucleotidyltransferase [Halomicroarcula sp. SHR3]
MSDEFDAVVSRVRERVSPSETERERLQRAAATVMERAREAVADLPVDAEVLQVGSTARGTWTAGDRDVDVFVAFPPDLERSELEAYGLEVGHAVLPEGHEEYAEHPYVVGAVDGYAVDLVPCYAVDDATAIQSAVDRTPFHTRYLATRLDDELAGEVRVTKQFLKGIGVYGSDLRTRGFSGYLTELLTVEYGGFREFVAAAADWHPPVRFDPEAHGTTEFDDPLVVVDPTDPDRNVAAVCSADNVARLQHYARALLSDPRESLFEPSEPAAYGAEAVTAAVKRRGTTPVAVRFARPDVVEDQLWPQLRKSLTGLTEELDRRGFDVFRSTALATDSAGGSDNPHATDSAGGSDNPHATDGADADLAGAAALLVELSVAERPAVERHEGPPVHVREHASGFYDTYADDPDVAGPYIDGDRYVVERPREFQRVEAFLDSDALLSVRLGPHVESALEDGYEVLVGSDIATLADTFGVDLAAYFEPNP